MMELRGIVTQTKWDERTKKRFVVKKAVLRSLETGNYLELDVSDVQSPSHREILLEVKRRLEKEGKKLVIPRHLKHLEGGE